MWEFTSIAVLRVSTHSRLKAAGHRLYKHHPLPAGFNTQPPEGGWVQQLTDKIKALRVSTHSRLKAAGQFRHSGCSGLLNQVSTHSRLKAAGECHWCFAGFIRRFNTQPPEGGWFIAVHMQYFRTCFNTQPPEGGWIFSQPFNQPTTVSTHSRLKAAGFRYTKEKWQDKVSTHSRRKAAGRQKAATFQIFTVSTHSRLKAAGTI